MENIKDILKRIEFIHSYGVSREGYQELEKYRDELMKKIKDYNDSITCKRCGKKVEYLSPWVPLCMEHFPQWMNQDISDVDEWVKEEKKRFVKEEGKNG